MLIMNAREHSEFESNSNRVPAPREALMPLLSSPSAFVAFVAFVGLAVLLNALPVWGADDLYLSEIEEEAKRQAATLIINPTAPNAATAPDTMADRLAPGLDTVAFERTLRAELPGTYVLYQQLDAARQRQVYAAYRRDNRLASISAEVARLIGGGS